MSWLLLGVGIRFWGVPSIQQTFCRGVPSLVADVAIVGGMSFFDFPGVQSSRHNGPSYAPCWATGHSFAYFGGPGEVVCACFFLRKMGGTSCHGAMHLEGLDVLHTWATKYYVSLGLPTFLFAYLPTYLPTYTFRPAYLSIYLAI